MRRVHRFVLMRISNHYYGHSAFESWPAVGRVVRLRAAIEAGIEVDDRLIVTAASTCDGGGGATHAVLGVASRVTALLSGNHHTSIGPLQALASRGLRVPGDVAVVSFYELGRKARETLINLCGLALHSLRRASFSKARWLCVSLQASSRTALGTPPNQRKPALSKELEMLAGSFERQTNGRVQEEVFVKRCCHLTSRALEPSVLTDWAELGKKADRE